MEPQPDPAQWASSYVMSYSTKMNYAMSPLDQSEALFLDIHTHTTYTHSNMLVMLRTPKKQNGVKCNFNVNSEYHLCILQF